MLGDTTRNAVIGKAHRLDLEARALSKQSSTPRSKDNRQIKRTAAPTSRKAKFQSILLDKSFEPENPKSLEDLTESTCKWPVGHPNEEKFYFCGRKPEGEFHIVNYTSYMHSNPRDLKKKFWIKRMKYQNL